MRARNFSWLTGQCAPLPALMLALWSCNPSNNLEPGTANAPPIPEHERAVIETPDPPPFDRPCRARSLVAWSRGSSVIQPSWHWDMELSSEPDRLSTAMAHSGASSMRMGPDMDYGPTVCRTLSEVADTLVAISMGFWLNSPDQGPWLTLVTTIHRGEEQLAWFGKDLKGNDHRPGEWVRFNVRHPIHDLALTGSDRVCCFLWNRNKSTFHVDDVDLVFQGPDVLGMTNATGHDLEQGGGEYALPFASVTNVTLLDPVEQGVRVGLAPPSATSGDLAITALGGTRWSYSAGDGVAYLTSPDGQVRALVRAWHPSLKGDLLDHEQVIVVDGPEGPIVTGFDVDVDPRSGARTVARSPAPRSAMLHLDLPTR